MGGNGTPPPIILGNYLDLGTFLLGSNYHSIRPRAAAELANRPNRHVVKSPFKKLRLFDFSAFLTFPHPLLRFRTPMNCFYNFWYY